MKIQSLRIENFRSFADETIAVDDYNCFVGQNGAGKSTILTALNIFFRETTDASTDLINLDEEDFHDCNTKAPIRITVTFEDLSPEAQEDLKDYFRQGQLIVSAVAEWDDMGRAKVKQFGNRLGIEQFRPYFERNTDGALKDELAKIYTDLRSTFGALPLPGTKGKMEQALRDFETEHSELRTLIPSEDQFYGISHGTDRLGKYIQWVYVAAVKDAVSEQREAKNTALSQLLLRRVHSRLDLKTPVEKIRQDALGQYQTFLDNNRGGLTEVATSLSARFQRWAHENAKIDLDWVRGEKAISVAQPTAEIKATEGLFAGELARFGHGLQRSFIFALLEELAEHDEAGPLLILGCEEPELYQHPPQARYMASVLERLSQHNSQVLICTHSPYFVSGKGFESIRIVQKNPATGCSSVKQTTFEEVANAIAAATGKKPDRPGGIAAKVEQELRGQMNEMFFAYLRIFVEGLEDLAYISSYMSLLDREDEFRALGCHIIQVQGKSHLIEALAISKQLGLPFFTVFDTDGDTLPDTAEKPTGRRKQHENENTAIFNLHDLTDAPAFPDEILWADNLVAWPSKIGDIVRSEFGNANWQKVEQHVRAKYNNFCSDMAKNTLFLGYMMSEAWEQGIKSAILIELCERILRYARGSEATAEPDASLALDDAVVTVD